MSTTDKQRKCDFATAGVSLVFCVLLCAASWASISSVHKEWFAPDYWLAWFSAFSLLGSVAAGVIFGISFFRALDCNVVE